MLMELVLCPGLVCSHLSSRQDTGNLLMLHQMVKVLHFITIGLLQ